MPRYDRTDILIAYWAYYTLWQAKGHTARDRARIGRKPILVSLMEMPQGSRGVPYFKEDMSYIFQGDRTGGNAIDIYAALVMKHEQERVVIREARAGQ